ncbi:Alpha/beta hydrolase family protein [Rubripirellula tenax]|uniref:Alpha/beta hydrolase family protein n=1 Tax=Rubripirellula tenax TaxID=2528015 RepID=A0A5C6EMS9_9BACT|nr:alpha/beta fold hydrolase [Rubripirellula tenax]TWU51033.1 Alpha/beta hydrolase family protein [Rubripirellula tenax]
MPFSASVFPGVALVPDGPIPNRRESRNRWVFLALTILIGGVSVGSSASGQTVSNEWLEVAVPSVDGRVRWGDVADAMADAIQLDKESVRGLLPDGEMNLSDGGVQLVLMGVNLMLGQRGSILMDVDAKGEPSIKLRLRIADEATKIESDGRAIRGPAPVTLTVDENWEAQTLTKPLVVCFHGLKSGPHVFSPLRDELRRAGYATATVSYDDRRSIADTAAMAADQCKAFFRSQVRTPSLALIGHSMGGLVTRQWAEDPKLADRHIVRLITIATPHGGSTLATMPPLIDLVTEGSLQPQDCVNLLLHLPSSPGIRDLEPGSPALANMNAWPRRSDVQYTCIAGTRCPVSAEDSQELRSMLRQLDQDGSFTRLIRPRILPLIQETDEWIEGKGDGAVSVSNAWIPGVKDHVEVPLAHSELIAPMANGSRNPVWQTILDRLGEER